MAKSNTATNVVQATVTPADSQIADNATVTSVPASVSTVTLLAANTARLGATVFNDSTAALYIKLGAGASPISFTYKAGASGYFEVPFGYIGQITGVWDTATGNARVTEVTS